MKDIKPMKIETNLLIKPYLLLKPCILLKLSVTLVLLLTVSIQNSEAKKYTNIDWNVNFNVPDNWVTVKSEQGYLIHNNTNKGAVVIIPHQANDINSLKTALKEGQGINDENINIFPATDFKNIGKNTIYADYKGTMNNYEVKATVIAVTSPYSKNGIVIVGFEENETYSGKYSKLSFDIAKNTSFNKIKSNPSITSNIRSFMANKNFFFENNEFNSSQNGSVSIYEKESFSFCSNNTFAGYRISYSSVSGGGMSSSSGSSTPTEFSGSWNISNENGKSFLILSTRDGMTFKNPVEIKNGKLVIGGRSYKHSNYICK